MSASDRTALYRLYDEKGVLLYLGITDDPKRRWAQHERTQHWWLDVAQKKVAWIASRVQAEALEAQATAIEKPKYDRHLSGIYRLDPPCTVRRHSDPAAEQKIRQAVQTIAGHIADGTYRPWTLMPSYVRLSERYALPIMAISTALRRLDFDRHLVTHLDGRFVVADSRIFPDLNARGSKLSLILAERHFKALPFTVAEFCDQSGMPRLTAEQHVKHLTDQGLLERLRVPGQRARSYAVANMAQRAGI